MREKTSGEVASEVVFLAAANPKASFLIVEGVDDVRFWELRVAQASCKIVEAGGKVCAVGAWSELDREGFLPFLAIVDRDYDDTTTPSNPTSGLIFWDAHSLEGELFCSESLDRVLSERLEISQRAEIESSLRRPIREYVLDCLRVVGILRCEHFHRFPESNTDYLLVPVLIDRATLEFGVSRAVDEFVARGHVADRATFDLLVSGYDQIETRRLTRGHDIADFLAALITSRAQGCNRKSVQQMLRLAYHRSDFERSSVYADIRAWESARLGYSVLH